MHVMSREGIVTETLEEISLSCFYVDGWFDSQFLWVVWLLPFYGNTDETGAPRTEGS